MCLLLTAFISPNLSKAPGVSIRSLLPQFPHRSWTYAVIKPPSPLRLNICTHDPQTIASLGLSVPEKNPGPCYKEFIKKYKITLELVRNLYQCDHGCRVWDFTSTSSGNIGGQEIRELSNIFCSVTLRVILSKRFR